MIAERALIKAMSVEVNVWKLKHIITRTLKDTIEQNRVEQFSGVQFPGSPVPQCAENKKSESEVVTMRKETYTVTRTYYTYDELSGEAKEKVREELQEMRQNDSDYFYDFCIEVLKDSFPNSELDVQFDLSYCQGDGLNIYGKLCLPDVLEHIKGEFSKDEMRFLNWAFMWGDKYYKMEENRHYCYCICDRHDYFETIESEMYWNNKKYGKKQINIMEKFSRLAGDFLTNICKELEKDGYEFFYNMQEDEIIDDCYANDYEFFEDGTLAS